MTIKITAEAETLAQMRDLLADISTAIDNDTLHMTQSVFDQQSPPRWMVEADAAQCANCNQALHNADGLWLHDNSGKEECALFASVDRSRL